MQLKAAVLESSENTQVIFSYYFTLFFIILYTIKTCLIASKQFYNVLNKLSNGFQLRYSTLHTALGLPDCRKSKIILDLLTFCTQNEYPLYLLPPFSIYHRLDNPLPLPKRILIFIIYVIYFLYHSQPFTEPLDNQLVTLRKTI